MMEEIMPLVTGAVMTILGILLTALTTIVGLKVNKLVENIKVKTGIEIDEKLAMEAVSWAQQVFKDNDGEEKFEKAKDRLILLMQARGVTIPEEALDTLIEKAVLGLKEGLKGEQPTVIEFEPVQLPVDVDVNLVDGTNQGSMDLSTGEITYPEGK